MECYAPHDILRSLDYMHMCVCFFFLFIRWPEIFVSLARSGNDLRLFIHIIYIQYTFFPHILLNYKTCEMRVKKKANTFRLIYIVCELWFATWNPLLSEKCNGFRISTLMHLKVFDNVQLMDVLHNKWCISIEHEDYSLVDKCKCE